MDIRKAVLLVLIPLQSLWAAAIVAVVPDTSMPFEDGQLGIYGDPPVSDGPNTLWQVISVTADAIF